MSTKPFKSKQRIKLLSNYYKNNETTHGSFSLTVPESSTLHKASELLIMSLVWAWIRWEYKKEVLENHVIAE